MHKTMSGISHHQNVFRVTKSVAQGDGSHPPIQKRNRNSINCAPCRARKLKCNRQTPCSSCTKRKDEASCAYDISQRKHERSDGGVSNSATSLRLQKLESMVMSLMNHPSGNEAAGSSFTNPASVDLLRTDKVDAGTQIREPYSEGHFDSQGPDMSYIGATHWGTILEKIRDIQGTLNSDDTGDRSSSNPGPIEIMESPDLVFDTSPPIRLEQILDTLPARPTVDRILSAFFNSGQIQVIPLIHRGKFLREYESFWAEPSTSSLLWISILFSICYLGSEISQANAQNALNNTDPLMRREFLITARRALVAGEYQGGKPYSVESLLLYATCEFTKKEDPGPDVWLYVGIAVRLAMKMGLHRDPRHFSHISAFDGEMRRRAFFFVEVLDLMLSCQAGLPSIVHEEECDVESPRNLFDSDFAEDCQVIPRSRPSNDVTPMLYYCTKYHVLRVLRRVHRLELSFLPRSYDDTMRLDHELHEAHKNVPQSLQMRPIGSSFTEPAYMCAHRLCLELLHLQVLCLLHRRHLVGDRSDKSFDYSRKVCVDAALEILKLQAELHTACQPGGQLSEDRWVLTSITLQVFLLAAMIVCLDLSETSKSSHIAGPERLLVQAKEYDALRVSYDIWMSRRGTSKDARCATGALRILLSKISRPNAFSKPSDISYGSLVGSSTSSDIQLRATNAITDASMLWNPTVSNDSTQGFISNTFDGLQTAYTDPLDTAFSGSDDIDWALIDQYLRSQNNGDGNEDWPFETDFGQEDALFTLQT